MFQTSRHDAPRTISKLLGDGVRPLDDRGPRKVQSYGLNVQASDGPSESKGKLLCSSLADNTSKYSMHIQTEVPITELLRILPCTYLQSLGLKPIQLAFPTITMLVEENGQPMYSLGRTRGEVEHPWIVTNGHVPVRMFHRLLFARKEVSPCIANEQGSAHAMENLKFLPFVWREAGFKERPKALDHILAVLKVQMNELNNASVSEDILSILRLLYSLSDFAAHAYIASSKAVTAITAHSTGRDSEPMELTEDMHNLSSLDCENSAQLVLSSHQIRMRKLNLNPLGDGRGIDIESVGDEEVSNLTYVNSPVSPAFQKSWVNQLLLQQQGSQISFLTNQGSQALTWGYSTSSNTDEIDAHFELKLCKENASTLHSKIQSAHRTRFTLLPSIMAKGLNTQQRQLNIHKTNAALAHHDNPFQSALSLLSEDRSNSLFTEQAPPLLLPLLKTTAQDVSLADDLTLQLELHRSAVEQTQFMTVRPSSSLLPQLPDMSMEGFRIEDKSAEQKEEVIRECANQISNIIPKEWCAFTQAWRLLYILPVESFLIPSQPALSILSRHKEIHLTHDSGTCLKLPLDIARFELIRWKVFEGASSNALLSIPKLIQSEIVRRNVCNIPLANRLSATMQRTSSENAWSLALLSALNGHETPGFIEWCPDRLEFRVSELHPANPQSVIRKYRGSSCSEILLSVRHLTQPIYEELERRSSCSDSRKEECPVCNGFEDRTDSSSTIALASAPRIPGRSLSALTSLIKPSLSAATSLLRLEKWAKSRLTPSLPTLSSCTKSASRILISSAMSVVGGKRMFFEGFEKVIEAEIIHFSESLRVSKSPEACNIARDLRAKVSSHAKDARGAGKQYEEFCLSRSRTHNWTQAILESIGVCFKSRAYLPAIWLTSLLRLAMDALNLLEGSEVPQSKFEQLTGRIPLLRQIGAKIVDLMVTVPDWRLGNFDGDIAEIGRLASESSVGQVLSSFAQELLQIIQSLRMQASNAVGRLKNNGLKSQLCTNEDGGVSFGGSLLSTVSSLHNTISAISMLCEITMHESSDLQEEDEVTFQGIMCERGQTQVQLRLRGLDKGEWVSEPLSVFDFASLSATGSYHLKVHNVVKNSLTPEKDKQDESAILKAMCSRCFAKCMVLTAMCVPSKSSTFNMSELIPTLRVQSLASERLAKSWIESLESSRVNHLVRLPVQGGALLTKLFRHGRQAYQLFVAAYEPYRLMLESWIYSGKLVDPYGEFLLTHVYREPLAVKGTLTTDKSSRQGSGAIKSITDDTVVDSDSRAIEYEIDTEIDFEVAVPTSGVSTSSDPAESAVHTQRRSRYRIYTERSLAPVPCFLEGLEDSILSAGQGLAILARASGPLFAAALSSTPPSAAEMENYLYSRRKLCQAKRANLIPDINNGREVLNVYSRMPFNKGDTKGLLDQLITNPSLAVEAQGWALERLLDPGSDRGALVITALLFKIDWSHEASTNSTISEWEVEGKSEDDTAKELLSQDLTGEPINMLQAPQDEQDAMIDPSSTRPLYFSHYYKTAQRRYQIAMQKRDAVHKHLVVSCLLPWLANGVSSFVNRIRARRRAILEAVSLRAAIDQDKENENRAKRSLMELARIDRLAEISNAQSLRTLQRAHERATDRLRLLSKAQQDTYFAEAAIEAVETSLHSLYESEDRENERLQWRLARLTLSLQRAKLIQAEEAKWTRELSSLSDAPISDEKKISSYDSSLDEAPNRRQWSIQVPQTENEPFIEARILTSIEQQHQGELLEGYDVAVEDWASHASGEDIEELATTSQLIPCSDEQMHDEDETKNAIIEPSDLSPSSPSSSESDRADLVVYEKYDDNSSPVFKKKFECDNGMVDRMEKKLQVITDWVSAAELCIAKPIILQAETIAALCVHLLLVRSQLPVHLASLKSHLLLASEQFGVGLARELRRLAQSEGLSACSLARKQKVLGLPSLNFRDLVCGSQSSSEKTSDEATQLALTGTSDTFSILSFPSSAGLHSEEELRNLISELALPPPLSFNYIESEMMFNYAKMDERKNNPFSARSLRLDLESDESDEDEDDLDDLEIGPKPTMLERQKYLRALQKREVRLEARLILAYSMKGAESDFLTPFRLDQPFGALVPKQGASPTDVMRFSARRFGATSLPLAFTTDDDRLSHALDAARSSFAFREPNGGSNSNLTATFEKPVKDSRQGLSTRLFLIADQERLKNNEIVPAEWWQDGNKHVPLSGQPTEIFQHLSLGYRAQWPLSLVISQTVIAKAYQPMWRLRMKMIAARLGLDDIADELRLIQKSLRSSKHSLAKSFVKAFHDSNWLGRNLIRELGLVQPLKQTLRRLLAQFKSSPVIDIGASTPLQDSTPSSAGEFVLTQMYVDAVSPGISESSHIMDGPAASGNQWKEANPVLRLARYWSGWGGMNMNAAFDSQFGTCAWWWKPFSEQPESVRVAFESWKRSNPSDRLKLYLVPLAIAFEDDNTDSDDHSVGVRSTDQADPELEALYNSFKITSPKEKSVSFGGNSHDEFLFERVFARPRRRLQMLLAQVDSQVGINRLPIVLDACRSEVRKAVFAFEDYTVTNVIVPAWDELLSDLSQCRSAEDIVEAHEQYARTILASSFLGGRGERTSLLIQDCLAISSRFVTLAKDAIFTARRLIQVPWVSPTVRGKNSIIFTTLERDRLRFARLTTLRLILHSLVKRLLPRVMTSFQQSILSLVRALRLAAGPRGDDQEAVFTRLSAGTRSAAASLLLKLDFNEHYATKTLSSASLFTNIVLTPQSTPRKRASTVSSSRHTTPIHAVRPVVSTTPAAHFVSQLYKLPNHDLRNDVRSRGDSPNSNEALRDSSDKGYTPLKPIRDNRSKSNGR